MYINNTITRTLQPTCPLRDKMNDFDTSIYPFFTAEALQPA